MLLTKTFLQTAMQQAQKLAKGPAGWYDGAGLHSVIVRVQTITVLLATLSHNKSGFYNSTSGQMYYAIVSDGSIESVQALFEYELRL